MLQMPNNWNNQQQILPRKYDVHWVCEGAVKEVGGGGGGKRELGTVGFSLSSTLGCISVVKNIFVEK